MYLLTTIFQNTEIVYFKIIHLKNLCLTFDKKYILQLILITLYIRLKINLFRIQRIIFLNNLNNLK